MGPGTSDGGAPWALWGVYQHPCLYPQGVTPLHHVSHSQCCDDQEYLQTLQMPPADGLWCGHTSATRLRQTSLQGKKENATWV